MSVTFKLNRNKKSLLITDSKVVKLRDEDELKLYKNSDLYDIINEYMKQIYLASPQLSGMVNEYIQNLIDEKNPKYALCKKIQGIDEIKEIYSYLNKYGKLHSNNKPLPKTSELEESIKNTYKNLPAINNNLNSFKNKLNELSALPAIEDKYGTLGFMKIFANFIKNLFSEISKYDPSYELEDAKSLHDGYMDLETLDGLSIPYSIVSYKKSRGDLSQLEEKAMIDFKIEFLKSLEKYIAENSDSMKNTDEDLTLFMNTIRNIVNSATSYDLLSLLNNIILKAEDLSVNTVRSKAEQEELELKNVDKNQRNAEIGKNQFSASQNAAKRDIIG